jgi:DNA-binding NarL/FixJ family response regulator
MVRLGMSRMLADDGVEVVEEEMPIEIVAQAERLLPDAVVLRLDERGASDLGERVRAVAPGAKVILMARDESEMRVFDPGSTRPRRIVAAGPDALVSEVVNSG